MKELVFKALTDKKSRNKKALNKIALTSANENLLGWS